MEVSVLVAAFVLASCSIGCFIAGVHWGEKQATRYKPEIQTIEIPKPFVVKETVVKETATPGFVYPQAGTPDGKREAEDKKFAELVSDPEI